MTSKLHEPLIYVLHCFQKKSKQGISTPKAEMDIIHARLRLAKELSRDQHH
ncbi:type II toxin-antitoxin system RelE/ParE family toxin [Deinococcus wulumuqiensis]